MMVESRRDLRVILIGGSSHAGKSTLAQSLALRLGWSWRSTDKLARHPGRPWQVAPKTVPEHVAEHYLSLSTNELVADVLRHYRDNVWPLVQDIVTSHATDLSADKLVMEGSAILPESAVTLPFNNVGSIWLTASNELFDQRIRTASQYETKSSREKRMVDSFLERTCLYNDGMMNAVNRLGLTSVDIENAADVNELTRICLSLLWKQDTKTPVWLDAGNDDKRNRFAHR